jgi:hypothetical protein
MGQLKLFPIRLIGAGTADVESFATYLWRLAEAHQVTLGRLVRSVLAGSAFEEVISSSTVSDKTIRDPINYYIRPVESTTRAVTAFAEATGQWNLRAGTFLALSAALDRCMNTFTKYPRWCPDCLAEFDQADGEPYLKLVWQVAPISSCPTHGKPLQAQCPHCRRHQDSYGFRPRCSICVRCGGSLSVASDQSAASSYAQVDGTDICELIERMGADPKYDFPAGGVRRVASELFDRAWERADDLRLWKLIPRDECLTIIDGSAPITLGTARRFAYRVGIRLCDLLEGQLAETTGVLDPTWTADLPPAMRPRRKAMRHDRIKLLKALETAIRTSARERPPTLRNVADSVGVSTGCLRYHFPYEAESVIRRDKEWKGEERHRKKVEARAAVLAELANSTSESTYSRKGLLREIRKRTGLPKTVVRHEIAVAMDEACNPTRSRKR